MGVSVLHYGAQPGASDCHRPRTRKPSRSVGQTPLTENACTCYKAGSESIFYSALLLVRLTTEALEIICISSKAQEVAAGAPAEVLLALLCHERADTGRTAAYSLPSALDARTVCSRQLCAGVCWPLYDRCSGTGAMSAFVSS